MKLAVVGTGLIGCSFAKAARRRDLFSEIVGLDAATSQAATAESLGIIDRVVDAVPEDADTVLLSPPSDKVAEWVVSLKNHPGVVFDVASVKQPVIKAIRAELKRLPPRFVPTHPVAGSERSGPEAASDTLFDGKRVVLTPESETDPSAVGVVQVLWRAVGAATHTMTAADHDRVLSVTSHLPHFLAIAFLDQVETDMLTFAGGGFRDFTRIAAANPDMWARIFELNKTPLLASLRDFRRAAKALETAVRQGDTDAVRAIIRKAAERRREFDDG